MEYKFRFTTEDYHTKRKSTMEAFIEAENRKDAEEKIHRLGLLTEVHLSRSLIVKTEILIVDKLAQKWEEIHYD